MGFQSSYGQYCPVAKAAEIFADRWTPLIVREFVCGTRHFNALYRGLPGISRSLLSQRLRRLESTGVIERRATGGGRAVEYHLTPGGLELQRVIDVLGEWGVRWAFTNPRPGEMDPPLLMWWVRRSINRELLPPGRTIVQFDFRGACRRTIWLVMEPTEVSLCLQHPGFDVDLLVTVDTAAFYRVWFGWMSMSQALDDGTIQLEGLPALVRAFPRWLKLSHFVPAVRAAVEERQTTLARAPRGRRRAAPRDTNVPSATRPASA